MSGSNQTWEIPSGEWNCKSSLGTPTPTSRSLSPQSRVGEAIFNNYLELINSKSNLSAEEIKQAERLERPFDFFDDEEFAFGINLLNNNVVCVGDNITKLIQLAQEPWPDNVKLFQPYEVEQILLPDNASCLAVQAFLKMCNLPFEVEMRWNAEFMSPSGRVPFIKCGAFVVSELEPIAQFAANKGVSLCSRLSTEEKAEMRAYMSLITNVLVNAELYISWLDNDTFNQVTKVRNSSVYPWPLGWLQTRTKRNAVAKRLKALHWHDKTLEQVLADVEQCCNSLSQRLGDKDYFFGSPTPLDALIYGHIRALLSAQGPKAALMIRPITSALLHHVIRITSFVGIKLTAQEEYLLRQAFTIRRPSPTRTISSERSSRARRSKLSIKHQSRDSLNKDMFGFKPFASKKIIIMTSKEGVITCKYDEMGRYGNCSCIDEEEYNLIIEVIEDIIDKVEETVIEKFNKNVDAENDKHDFEVIAFPHQLGLLKNESLSRLDELLEPLEENDITDVTDISIEELIQMTDDDNDHVANNNDHIGDSNDHIDDNNDHIGDNNDLNNNDLNNSDLNNNDLDSDGLINEKHLASENTITNVQPNEASPSPGSNEPFPSSLTDSSNNVHMREDDGLTTITSSGDRPSAKDLTTKSSSSSRFSSDSKVTLKMFNDEQISVESLLNYLRKRNAAYNLIMPDAADVD